VSQDPQDISGTNDSTDTFVVKTYLGRNAVKSWESEIAAFEKLRTGTIETPNVIKFYSSFMHGTTHNIILEYADKGSLADWIRRTLAPVGGQDTLRFWTGVLGLTRGLRDLHHGSSIVYACLFSKTLPTF